MLANDQVTLILLYKVVSVHGFGCFLPYKKTCSFGRWVSCYTPVTTPPLVLRDAMVCLQPELRLIKCWESVEARKHWRQQQQ